MGRAQRKACNLCLQTPNRNAMTKVDSLPKTFTYILQELSGIRFDKKNTPDMVVCMKCLQFLKDMESTKGRPNANRISAAGKKRVFKLMEKKRMPAGEAIEIVLAEQRAKELLVESGVKKPDEIGQSQLKNMPTGPKKPRLSGAQRKKAGILMDAGMEPAAARELIYAATLAKVTAREHDAAHLFTNAVLEKTLQTVSGLGLNGIENTVTNANVNDAPRRRRRNRRGQNRQNAEGQNTAGVAGPVSQSSAGQRQVPPKGGVAQNRPAGQQKPAPQKGPAERTPIQRVAPVRGAPQKPGPVARVPVTKAPNQKVAPVQKPSVTTGILVQPTNKRQNSNTAGGRSLNSDKRLGAFVAPRRNDRPVPYNNRQQNQPQQQQSQNKNFNQQQQQQNTSLQVGIVPINYPNDILDDMKLDALKDAITNEILKIPQGGPLVRFLGTSAQDGWLKVICADQLSFNWLAMLVSRWERAGVRMVEGNALPKPMILSFYIQGDFRSPDIILNIIEKQNNSLHANQWRVINRESDGNGQLITVCVNEQCFHALQSRDFMVFLGLGVVELKPRRSSSDEGSFRKNQSSQHFGSNGNSNYGNSGGNNMQGGGGNNYQSGRNNGGGGGNFGNNQSMGQNYQRGGGYQNQRVW